MSWHNIRQAQELTGKSRSTLYRDMNAGRVSYRTEADARRYIETTELIRVYGELRRGAAPNDTPDDTQARNSRGQLNETGAAASHEVSQAVSEAMSGAMSGAVSDMVQELRALREEVQGLRTELREQRLLEHKPEPEPEPVAVQEPAQEPVRSWWRKLWG